MQRWPPATFLLALGHIGTNENIRTKGHFVGHRDISGHYSNRMDFIIKTFLFVGNIARKCFKAFHGICLGHMQSFIKIGGLVIEKNLDKEID